MRDPGAYAAVFAAGRAAGVAGESAFEAMVAVGEQEREMGGREERGRGGEAEEVGGGGYTDGRIYRWLGERAANRRTALARLSVIDLGLPLAVRGEASPVVRCGPPPPAAVPAAAAIVARREEEEKEETMGERSVSGYL